MKKLVVIGIFGIAFTACNPDIPSQSSLPVVTAQFDPRSGVVPTPTLLAPRDAQGRLAIPVAPDASPAQKDFVQGFLNTLDGFPGDTPAAASFDGPLLPSSVNTNSIRVLDMNAQAPVGGFRPVYNPASPTKISILPPPTGWPLGHVIGIALLGHQTGLSGAAGEPVVGSSVWGLVRSKDPLVKNCTTLFLMDGSINPDCQSATNIIPSDIKDPAGRLQDQAASAVQLEQLRQLYEGLLNALEAQRIPRDTVVLAWNFKVTSQPQVTFDPANSVIPFPNNLVTKTLSDGGIQVDLPVPSTRLPDGGTPDVVALYTGLNFLDGFSTTAPIVSVFNADNANALPAIGGQRLIDSNTLDGGTGFRRLPSGPGAVYPPTTPLIKTCLDCIPNPLPDGGTPTGNPQQLLWVPTTPLDERTNYGVYITTDLKDTQGKNVIPSSPFVLLRSNNPLVDGSGKSTVDLITDDQAQVLDTGRKRLKSFLDLLAATAQIPRSKIALAWAFTTQTEETALVGSAGLHGLPTAVGTQQPATFPATPLFLAPTTMPRVFIGEIIVPQILNGPSGTLSPLNPIPKKIWFLLAVPSGPGPYPVTIFGHALTRSRTDMLRIVGALTSGGEAVIATDVVWHGDRSSCAGSRAFLTSLVEQGLLPAPLAASDDFACIDPSSSSVTNPGKCDVNPMSPTFGRCVATSAVNRAPCSGTSPPPDAQCNFLRQGFCLPDAKCEGGDFRRPADLDPLATDPNPLISGWNIFSVTNLFATRDNLREQVVDLAQLTRVIVATGAGSLNALLGSSGVGTLDSMNINYVGQSLGGILGTLFTSAAPEIHRVVLNVPGGDFTDILLNADAFKQVRDGFFTTLASQTPPITQGTAAFATFISIAKWILDPADPVNAGYAVLNNPGLPVDRKAFIQYITQDQTIPNTATDKLRAAAGRGNTTPDCFLFNPPVGDPLMGGLQLRDRHGFLLNNINSSVTSMAQTQVVNYVRTGVPPPGGCP